MTTPYVYMLEWSNANMTYIGSRWARGCHPSDLWVSYFTSSKYVRKFAAINGTPKVTIVMICETGQQALDLENALLYVAGVPNNPNYLNRHVFGRWNPQDPAIRAKQSAAATGRAKSAEHIEKIRAAKMGNKNRLGAKLTIESRAKISEANRTRPISNETRAKMRAAHKGVKFDVVTCPHCGKSGGLTGMKCWHFDRCKLNPNGSNKP